MDSLKMLSACSALLLLPWATASGSVSSRIFMDPSGQPLAKVTVETGDDRSSSRYLSALRIVTPPGASAGAQPFQPFSMTDAMEDLQADLRRSFAGDKEAMALDWGGVHVSVEPLAQTTCNLFGLGAAGTIRKNQSALFDVPSASAAVNLLVPMKGNPDLFVHVKNGPLLCESTSHVKKVPDDCSWFASDCIGGETVIEVFGVKKKNGFIVVVWLFGAQ